MRTELGNILASQEMSSLFDVKQIGSALGEVSEIADEVPVDMQVLVASFYFILKVENRSVYRMFSHDVTVAMVVFQTNSVGVELFFTQTLYSGLINLWRCWPCERKCPTA